MPHLPTTILATLLAGSALETAAQASGPYLAIEAAARETGFTATWLGAQGAMQLTRAGLTIVVRPGDIRYDVNDGSRTFTSAPRVIQGDVFVPVSFVRDLRRLGGSYPASLPLIISVAPPSPPDPSGALGVSASRAKGSERLQVSLTGPALTTAVVSLFASLAPELPRTLVDRVSAQLDAGGHAACFLPTGGPLLPGTTLTVSASAPGLAEATTTLPAQ